jgi:hypothetical protein
LSDVQIIRSPYRCRDCDVPFRHDTPFNVEVSVYCNFILSLRCPTCNGSKLTLGFNLTEAENAALRIAGTIEQRARNWHDNAEVGTSSLTIFHFFMGALDFSWAVPADLADLRRCLFLLEHVPEWRPRMHELASVKGWERLAHGWIALTAQFRAEAPDLRGSAPMTEQLLHSLTCEMETTNS